MNPRRLYRCRQDRMLAGVAGGMAEYLEIDPTVVRILWLLSIVLGGFSILLYIVLAFVVPLEPVAGPMMPTPGSPTAAEDATAPTTHTTWAVPVHDGRPDGRRTGNAGLFIGVLLVVFGSIALVGAVIPGLIAGSLLGPAFVLGLGVALLVGAIRRPAAEP